MSNEIPPSTLAAGLRACACVRPSVRQIMAGLIGAMACLLWTPLYADDTSLYVYESSNRSDERPQVLVIFDNSGSMDTTVYGVNPSFSSADGDLSESEQVYYSLDAAEAPPNPANPAEKRFFTFKRNA